MEKSDIPAPGTATLPALPSLLRRLAAMAYDGLLILALAFVVSALMLLISGGHLGQPDRPLWLLWAHRIVLAASVWGFFAWFWTHGGQTLGMRAWRLRLVATDGGPVTWAQAVRRFAGATLSLAALGLGYLWILFDPEQRSWHDRLSGTHLILVPKRH